MSINHVCGNYYQFEKNLAVSFIVMQFKNQLPAWGFMWSLCFAIFLFCKILSLLKMLRSGVVMDVGRKLAYILLWPGMDAMAFATNIVTPHKINPKELVLALLKMMFGLVCFFVIARLIPLSLDLLRGWIGMLGLIFTLHFGVFHLLALFWQGRGVGVKPLFRSPASATSLGEFWGGRWNDAFRQLSHDFIYLPMRPYFGRLPTLMLVFLISGLIHEAVISLPAGGGYGLPTMYFLVQGVGMMLERSRQGVRLGLGTGKRGWLFVVMCTATPAFWLFHPVFVRQVILPFMSVAHAF